MPYLDELFARSDTPAFAGPQCWAAKVVEVGDTTVSVVIPTYNTQLRWTVAAVSASVAVGDEVGVAMDETGTLRLLGGGGDGGGGDGGGGNIDGGFPDSVYGGLPLIDANGVVRS